MFHRALIARVAAASVLLLGGTALLAAPAAADDPTFRVTIAPGDVEFLDSYEGIESDPLAGAVIAAVDAATGIVADEAQVDNDWSLGGQIDLHVPPGDYRLRVVADGWLTGWYTGPATADLGQAMLSLYGWHPLASAASATVVTVGEDGRASAPDPFVMMYRNSSMVGGIVSRWVIPHPAVWPDGTIIYAELIDRATSEVVSTQRAGATAIYAFRDVAPGDYTIRATVGTAAEGIEPTGPDDLENSATWWYPGTQVEAEAGSVTVAPGGGHWFAANIATDGEYLDNGTALITGDLYAGGLVRAGNPDDELFASDAFDVESVTWYLDGVPVGDETAQTLVLPADSAGKTLSAEVRANFLPAGLRTLTTATADQPVAAASGSVFTAPIPTISGQPILGKTLTAQPGTWTPAGSKSFQWYRDEAPIDGATAKQYVVTEADLGTDLTVTVTGAKNGYMTAHRTSEPVSIDLAEFTAAPVPTIKGAVKFGSELSVGGGNWKPQPVDVAYQWFRDGVAIDGANAATYVLGVDDVGATITVSTTGTKAGYRSATQTSAPTGAVATLPITAPKPPLLGTAQVGQTLSIDTSGWSPADVQIAYEWQRQVTGTDYAAIDGATNPTYTLTAADAGKKVRLVVRVSKPGYTELTRTTAATAKVVT